MTEFHVLFTALSLTWLYMLGAIVALSMVVALIAKAFKPKAKDLFMRARVFAFAFGALYSFLYLFLFAVPMMVKALI